MNRILVLITVFSLFFLSSRSQTAREEIADDVLLSGHYITAYPGPLQDTLSPAPAGKKPFYISHYGRHGSRWMNNATFYNKPIDILQAAEGQGVLSAFGKKILTGLKAIANDADGRYEELSPVGTRQWQGIGRRMAKNFPEVFGDGTLVDARSTVYTRCILSMSGAVMELKAFNPKLRIEERASEQDMPFLLSGFYSNASAVRDADIPRTITSKSITEPKIHSLRVARELISDINYIKENVDTTDLFNSLFSVISSVQNSDLGDSLSLYDIFIDEELYEGWRVMNVKSYNSYHKGTKAKTLLNRLVEDADEAIAKGGIAAHLRFGHEIVLLPSVCLMGLNDLDHDWNTADEIEAAGWRNYHIYPMAGNFQVIFYRSDDNDPDVLVKILLNEKEATLPLPTDNAPYYHWSDVRDFWLSRAK